jgi:hypothetical protein
MSIEQYWISKTVVIDWSLKKLDGTAATGATVTGTFVRPDATTVAGTVADVGLAADGGELYRVTYDVDQAGTWAYRLSATGTADSAEQGTFYVRPNIVGGPVNTYDPTTDPGMVRLLISDTDVNDAERCIFTDAEIAQFLVIEAADVKRAAAQALETIASNEALVSKVITSQDISTNGAAVAAELRARAQVLRDQAEEVDGFGFDIAEFSPYGIWPVDA